MSDAVEPLPVPVFDAHTHLDAMAQRAGVEADEAFVAQAMADARAAGVLAAITVGDTVASSRWCVAAAQAHPDVYAAVAVHPTEIAGLDDAGYADLESLARDPRVVAVGETGLDYYWDRTTPAAQQEHFRRHIDLAKRVGKPLMIHDRDAHRDVLGILRAEGAPEQVVFHAFSGGEAMARECVDAGYVLSFPGVITFKNAPALREAAAVVPAEHLLVETDAPFLTPHPLRGRPNAPRLLPLTVRGLAAATGLEVDELCAAVTTNGRRVFGVPG
ncbi:TatD family hydrolase [uncultured Jatrophihabitans sp.]|uniref:TatD family hydrolase n=1 Tax=uncultured Jatrophihabitans sp. TaxID=1610747 RepID=UPI0035CC4DC9